MAAFELDWQAGVAERYFRCRRSGTVDFPWATLDPRDYPPDLVDRARSSWTDAAFAEYSTGAAFAEILQLLIAARAPIDLIGMAGDFVADEMLHVELTSRVEVERHGVRRLAASAALVRRPARAARRSPATAADAAASDGAAAGPIAARAIVTAVVAARAIVAAVVAA